MKRFCAAFYALAGLTGSLLQASQPTLTTLYTLNGAYPLGLTSARGALYGAARDELGPAGGCGLIFELQSPNGPGGSWTETVLYSFINASTDACDPAAPPAAGPNGVLYGVTYGGGAYGGGAAYQLQPPTSPGGAWSESVIYSFAGPIGPYEGEPTSFVMGPNGPLYVTTTDGGNGAGALVELQPPASPGGAWTATLLYSFPGGTGGSVPTSLTFGADGDFYGVTEYGGSLSGRGYGTVFVIRPPSTPGAPWTGGTLFRFTGNNGAMPNGVVRAPYGSLYGSAFAGPTGGPVFQLTPPSSPGVWTQTVLATFGPGYSAMCGPDSPLILRNGNLYGASCLPNAAGLAEDGVIFELQPPSMPGGPWINTPLYTFTGQIPTGAMIMTNKGTIYGVTNNPSCCQQPGGTIYQLTTQ
jgi:hypothetical protein